MTQQTAKERISALLDEVEKELEQDLDTWADEAITRLEKLCKNAKERKASIVPRLCPIPEVKELTNVMSIFR